MAAIFERNSEAGFLFSSMIEFINLWKSEKEGSIKIECKEGKANLSFSCSLGHPDAEHLNTNRYQQQGKVKSKSATRRARDRARAERFQAKSAPASSSVVSPVSVSPARPACATPRAAPVQPVSSHSSAICCRTAFSPDSSSQRWDTWSGVLEILSAQSTSVRSCHQCPVCSGL